MLFSYFAFFWGIGHVHGQCMFAAIAVIQHTLHCYKFPFGLTWWHALLADS